MDKQLSINFNFKYLFLAAGIESNVDFAIYFLNPKT